MLAGMCKNPQVDMDDPAVAELMADVAAAVSRRVAVVSEDVNEVILREIPELRDDKPVLALLASSVHSNVGTCLQIMQHQIDLSAVQAPAASLEYARRRAQRGTPLTALLRAYRLGHTCFSDWLVKELARLVSAAGRARPRWAKFVASPAALAALAPVNGSARMPWPSRGGTVPATS